MIWQKWIIIIWILSVETAFAAPSDKFEAISEFGWFAQNNTPVSDLSINQIHSWHLMITDDKGIASNCRPQPIKGGMPAHRHGLPTQPQWHQEQGTGRYRIDGLKFQMPGMWQVIFSCIDDSERNHEFTFEFML